MIARLEAVGERLEIGVDGFPCFVQRMKYEVVSKTDDVSDILGTSFLPYSCEQKMDGRQIQYLPEKRLGPKVQTPNNKYPLPPKGRYHIAKMVGPSP